MCVVMLVAAQYCLHHIALLPRWSKCVTVLRNYVLQNKNSDFCAPLTSFDWNEVDPNLLGTSSIDTTCTVWGLEVCPGVCSHNVT